MKLYYFPVAPNPTKVLIYLKEKGIKHMSFHSYIKKLSSGIDKGKYAALEDISCQIKKGCNKHAPWPEGIW